MSNKLYAVTYMCYHENIMETVFVTSESTNEVEVLNEGLRAIFKKRYGDKFDGSTGYEDCKNLEAACEAAFNGDSLVHVKRFVKSEVVIGGE
jgi:hypothetical protein